MSLSISLSKWSINSEVDTLVLTLALALYLPLEDNEYINRRERADLPDAEL